MGVGGGVVAAPLWARLEALELRLRERRERREGEGRALTLEDIPWPREHESALAIEPADSLQDKSEFPPRHAHTNILFFVAVVILV